MLKLLQHSFCRLSRGSTSIPIGRLSTTVSAVEQKGEKQENEARDSQVDQQIYARQLPDEPVEEIQEEAPPRKQSPYLNEQEENFTPFRYVYPEFLPDPNLKWRNRIREKLERMDMLKRRSNIDIPEFYVGSILSVTVSDRNAPGKTTTFVGICTERDKNGTRSNFTLRNVVDGHGVEICYDLYNPTILNITCLRLEKRLDENLRYLRDAPLEYSTFPFDMIPELRSPDDPVPINPIKVKLNPKPWLVKWNLWYLRGVTEDSFEPLDKDDQRRKNTYEFIKGKETIDYDLMKTYRETIPAEDQAEIYSEVHQQLAKLTASLRKQKRKRAFVKPQKTV